MDLGSSVGVWDGGTQGKWISYSFSRGQGGNWKVFMFPNLIPSPSAVVFAEEINECHGNIYYKQSPDTGVLRLK